MNVPRLRFKDDDGREFPEWGIKLLGEISKFLDGRRRPIKESDRSKMKGQYPYYGASGIIDYVNDYIFDENIILLGEDGENILSRNLPLAFKVSGKCWVNNHAHVIKPNLSTNIDFLTQYLDSISYVKYNTGTAQPKLNQEVCRTIPLNLPSLPEQTKIANFLTAIDEKITQLTQKYDLLKQYKKAVMQQIFSQKLRFKDEDGREFPEWEEKKLGDVVDNYGGTALEEFVTEKGTHNFISIGNYEKDGRYFDNGQRITLNEKTKLRLLNAGELVMVLNDKTSSGDLIGSTLLIPEDNKYIYNQRSERLVCKSEIIDSKYAWHLLNSPKFRKLIYSISQGGTQIYVNFPSVKKLNAPIPSLPEQTKIANFLTAIDDKITHTRTQLDAVKLYKKGLLQQLFI